MLDELTVLQTLQKPKAITAHPAQIETLPFVESHISFRPLLNYLKEKVSGTLGTKERLYSHLIKRFEQEPLLLDKIDDISILEQHSGLMELLTTALFPIICSDQQNFALASPYQYRVFYYSDSFRQLFFDQNEEYLLLPDGLPMERLKAVQCAAIYDHILDKFYGMHLNEEAGLVYPVTDPETGMLRYYRIRYDCRFIDLQLKGELPAIQDCGVCMNTFRILDLEKQLAKMPLSLFSAEGFAIWVAEDITSIESLEVMKEILLRENCGMETMDELKMAVKALVGMSNIEVGVMPFVKLNGTIVLDEIASRSSIVSRQWLSEGMNCEAFRDYVGFLQQKPVPTPISNLSEEMVEYATFLRFVYDNGARSYLCYPMQNSDGLIGVLELSSPVRNSLTQDTVSRLETAIPLLSLAVLRCLDDFENRIEKLIKEKFTALQPSVEWKFADVAWNYLRSDNKVQTENVVFDNVYPLYGAIDIRNSSVERIKAIQKDLKEHLSLIAVLLQKLQSIVNLPIIEDIEFRNQSILQAIAETMNAEDEIRITDFVRSEVEPLFMHLQKTSSAAQEIIGDYFMRISDEDCILYRNRRDYESSVEMINNVLADFIDKEEEVIQKSYPHYFEKYRTDGVEYNIYIGQSIAPTNPFDLLYLKNIRLWQLKLMVEAAKITQGLLPKLKIPLQTTQLVLIHSQPISIAFRRDERKFDVEGSYNIRYEVIKKRLDKVHIKCNSERLTQPGMIAMVYSNPKEASEYEEYIGFLQRKGLIKPGMEVLELEELQGVSGLKALRVTINMDA